MLVFLGSGMDWLLLEWPCLRILHTCPITHPQAWLLALVFCKYWNLIPNSHFHLTKQEAKLAGIFLNIRSVFHNSKLELPLFLVAFQWDGSVLARGRGFRNLSMMAIMFTVSERVIKGSAGFSFTLSSLATSYLCLFSLPRFLSLCCPCEPVTFFHPLSLLMYLWHFQVQPFQICPSCTWIQI